MCHFFTACSLVSFSQGLSVMIQCFFLTTNQHQSDLSAQKPTNEQAVNVKDHLALNRFTWQVGLHNLSFLYIKTAQIDIVHVLFSTSDTKSELT